MAPKYFLYLGLYLFVFSSCGFPNKLNRSLRESGANRVELEKVLDHYKSVGDKQALDAAKFLISNMNGHYSYESESLNGFNEKMDSLYPDMSNVVRRVIYQIPMRVRYADYTKKYDVEFLNSEFLISHIDRMMEIWHTCRWLSENSFDDFCEYLLPYRFVEGPLCPDLDSTDFWWSDICQEVTAWNNLPLTPTDIRQFLHQRINNADNIYKQDLKLPDGKLYTFDCEDNCHYEASTLRSCGVPVALDFVPEWSTRNGRHYWSVIVDPYYIDDNSSNSDNLRAGKVYRRTYSHHPIPKARTSSKEIVPELFQSPFLKDVTSQYACVSDVALSVKTLGCKYVYLAVFNEMQWKPVAWSRHFGPFVRFRNMGCNGVYLPVIAREDGLYAVGQPFILHADGKRESLCPSSHTDSELILTRKYPLTYSKTQWGKDLLEYSFEASEDSDFTIIKYAQPIVSINHHLNVSELEVPDSVPSYRYWRITGSRIYVGELSYLDSLHKVIDSRCVIPEMARKENSDTYLKAFDNDVLSYTTTPGWIGVDFGKPQKVSAIRYSPRTDDNGIVPGNTYELFVFDNGWNSLGKQQAETDSLCFEAPSGALYWLRCLDGGREERIFTYENGRQVWW